MGVFSCVTHVVFVCFNVFWRWPLKNVCCVLVFVFVAVCIVAVRIGLLDFVVAVDGDSVDVCGEAPIF